MARIPDAELERLKAEVSLEQLVEASGIALSKSNKDRLGPPREEPADPTLGVGGRQERKWLRHRACTMNPDRAAPGSLPFALLTTSLGPSQAAQ